MDNTQTGQYLAGKLLVAMPSMGDDRFKNAVIYIGAHDEQGAMGLVINNPMIGMDFGQLLTQLDIQADIKININNLDLPIMSGGPVEAGRGFLLHSSDFSIPETVQVNDSIGITGTLNGVKEILLGNAPEKSLFILGYAGWQAGQLEAELQQNTWLVHDASYDLIFHNNHEEKYKMTLAQIGVDFGSLASMGGSA